VELARTRITGVSVGASGYSQTANFALTRIATLTGVYGLSFEILLVNSVFAAAFLASRGPTKALLAAGVRGGCDLAGGAMAGSSAVTGIAGAAGAARIFDPRRRAVDEGIFQETLRI